MRELEPLSPDPLQDLLYRHEADKLYMLESIAIDAGHEMERTIIFDIDAPAAPMTAGDSEAYVAELT